MQGGFKASQFFQRHYLWSQHCEHVTANWIRLGQKLMCLYLCQLMRTSAQYQFFLPFVKAYKDTSSKHTVHHCKVERNLEEKGAWTDVCRKYPLCHELYLGREWNNLLWKIMNVVKLFILDPWGVCAGTRACKLELVKHLECWVIQMRKVVCLQTHHTAASMN